MTDPKILEGIRAALDMDPGNIPLWIHYADLLEQDGQNPEALEALRMAVQSDQDEAKLGVRFIRLLRVCDKLHEALIRAEKLLEKGEDSGLRLELARVLLARGEKDEAREQYMKVVQQRPALMDRALEQAIGDAIGSTGPVKPKQGSGASDKKADAAGSSRSPNNMGKDNSGGDRTGKDQPTGEQSKDKPKDPAQGKKRPVNPLDEGNIDPDIEDALAAIAPEPMNTDEWAAQFDWEGLCVTFADVAGLDDVKRQIDLRIIAPFKNPEIYRAFRRQGGGGIMLYGPPGCGKTYIAKATAGELDARFLVVSLHEVIDKYWGESEKMVHAIFQEARMQTPAVLFFDEFDALGSSRGKSDSQFFRTLVNQLLQEMDGLEGQNDDILLFAATNMPWTVDSAFRRPGRFDRVLFVPPPDREARAQILKIHTRKVPGGDKIPVDKLAKETPMMTGADLKALCEQAVEYALERSLTSGKVESVTLADFKKALKEIKSSAMEWLSTAKNYAKYANEAGYYDDLAEFLRKCKRW